MNPVVVYQWLTTNDLMSHMRLPEESRETARDECRSPGVRPQLRS